MIEFEIKKMDFNEDDVIADFAFYEEDAAIYELQIETNAEASILELKRLAIENFRKDMEDYGNLGDEQFQFRA